MRNGPEE
jgi:hypothetical protein